MRQTSNSASVMFLFTLVLGATLCTGCDEAMATPGKAGSSMSTTAPEPKPAAPASAAPFHGTFWTDVNGTRIVLRLEQSGATVTGKVDGATISGRADGSVARGDVSDPQSPQIAATFEMARKGAQLAFTLTLRDPQSGQTATVPTITLTAGEPPRVDAKLDQRAIGRWRHTWARASGDFTVAIDVSMILGADGSFAYGDSKMAGGGADSSFVGNDGEVERGHWCAEGGVLYASQDNGATWHPYAKYAISGDTMMLTYDNGKKQIWERQ